MFKHVLMQKMKQKRRQQQRQFFLFSFLTALFAGAVTMFATSKKGKESLKKAGEVISEKAEEGKEVVEKVVSKAKAEIKAARAKSNKVVEVKAKPIRRTKTDK
ncbi:MAG: hypothetical protein OHK0017_12480 [Patescibacteria group bacterium]